MLDDEVVGKVDSVEVGGVGGVGGVDVDGVDVGGADVGGADVDGADEGGVDVGEHQVDGEPDEVDSMEEDELVELQVDIAEDRLVDTLDMPLDRLAVDSWVVDIVVGWAVEHKGLEVGHMDRGVVERKDHVLVDLHKDHGQVEHMDLLDHAAVAHRGPVAVEHTGPVAHRGLEVEHRGLAAWHRGLVHTGKPSFQVDSLEGDMMALEEGSSAEDTLVGARNAVEDTSVQINTTAPAFKRLSSSCIEPFLAR